MRDWRDELKQDIGALVGVGPDDIQHVDIQVINSAAGVDAIFADITTWDDAGEPVRRSVSASAVLTLMLHAVLDLPDQRDPR